jgi:hypothetical protein
MLAVLGWLLARLVWLYYFFGLFFFLVAGLLVGGIAFRLARSARPIEKGRLIRGIVFVTLGSTLITVNWEYRHFADTVGQPPKFAEARNAAVTAGQPPGLIRTRASDAFTKHLRENSPPGGMIGYVRWAVHSGEARLAVDSTTEKVVIDHRHWVWAVRTLAGALLLAAGLWFSLESLRSSSPVSNLLVPGEEAPEEMQSA